jgi:hypothetical protein
MHLFTQLHCQIKWRFKCQTHTLVVPEDVTEMATLFHVTGGYTYVDPFGKAMGYEDVFTKLENARQHFERVGLGADYANRFLR